MTPNLPPQLRDRYKEGRLLPFIGAGVSMAVSWTAPDGTRRSGVSWRQLVDESARQLGFPDPALLRVRGNDLQILEYFREKTGGMAALQNWFNTEMQAPDDALSTSAIHRAFARLGNCSTFYTTNFDDFLERAMRLHGRDAHVSTSELSIAQLRTKRLADPTAVEIVKFHGDLNSPDKMILSEDDYEERLKLNEEADKRLEADLLGMSLLFAGYSFSDYNVSYLYRLFNETRRRQLPLAPNGHRAYMFFPDPSDFEITLFAKRNIYLLPIGRRNMADDIAESIDWISS
jgi:hypothetical protein